VINALPEKHNEYSHRVLRRRFRRAAGRAAGLCAGGGRDLDQAWETALAADRRMRAAGHHTQSAEETLAAARGARLPRLSVEGGYTFWITRRPSW